jgi:hypothetical protein
MLGSASRLRDALWLWTREPAEIVRQAATADSNSKRKFARTTLAVSLTSVVYTAFGAVVWSAYDRFGQWSLRDATPLVVAAAPAKLAAPRRTLRGSGADRPPIAETLGPAAAGEGLPAQSPATPFGESVDDPAEPASLSARAHSVARAGPGRAARPDPSAGPLRDGPVAAAAASSAAGVSAGSVALRLAAGMGRATTAPTPSGVPAKPQAKPPLPPAPSFKPANVLTARVAADRALSSGAAARTTAAAAGPEAGVRMAPRPAFKPRGERFLASGERARMAAAAARPRSGLRSFWSSFVALFTPSSRPWLVADNGGGREADAGVGDTAGTATDGAGTGGGTGGNPGSDASGNHRGSDPDRGGRDDGDRDDGGRGRGGGDDDDGGRGGGDDASGGRGRGGGGGDDDGGGRGRGGDDDDGGGRGRGGDDDNDGGRGGGQGGDDDDD